MAELSDIYEIKFYCLQSISPQQLGLNVLHYKVLASLGTSPPEQDIADAFAGSSAAVYKALLSQDAEFYGVGIQKIFPLPKPVATFSANGRGAGTDAFSLMPTQVTGLLTWRTEFAGRAFRGRSYLPFPAKDASSGDEIPGAAYLANLFSWATAISAPLTVGGGGNTRRFELGIWQRHSSAWVAVHDFLVRRKWATQRRRGDYGRINTVPF
jgi:hypothetical protein